MIFAGLGLAALAFRGKKNASVTAPAPTTAGTPTVPALTPPTPLDAGLAQSSGYAQAQLAAKKARQRAGASGATLMTGGAPGAGASLQPRTLLGA